MPRVTCPIRATATQLVTLACTITHKTTSARPPPPDSNAAFQKQLQQNVNTRRIAFANDIITVLPCTSPAKPDPQFGASYAMPACATGAVPTPRPDGKWYWNE